MSMCLAIPARVVELRGTDRAVVDLSGVRKEISLALVEGIGVGDYVIVHVGYALSRLDPEEAERTLALFAEGGVLGSDSDEAGPPPTGAPATERDTAPAAAPVVVVPEVAS
jgi:hydrogenase expression/formation protein HypC